MSKRDPSIKLVSVEANLKRWHTRLTRAANMVAKLEKYRRRLMLEKAVESRPVVAPVKVRKQIEAKAELVQAIDDQLTNVIEGKPVDIGKIEERAIPAFLDRSDVLIAEKMTAARKAAEAAERKKMPLTGKAASDYIKAPRKRKA